MPLLSSETATRMHRLNGCSARTRSIGTKLTPTEEEKILAAAEADGKTPSEWVREKLLECAVPGGGGSAPMLTHIFADLVGLQLLFMNVLAPFVTGETVSKERVTQIFREIQKSKAGYAQDTLARRAQHAKKPS